MILSNDKIYYVAFVLLVYITLHILIPPIYFLKKGKNIKKWIVPLSILIPAQTIVFYFCSRAAMFLFIIGLPTWAPLVFLGLAAVVFLFSQLLVFFLCTRRKKIDIYEHMLISSYSILPVMMYMLGGCLI